MLVRPRSGWEEFNQVANFDDCFGQFSDVDRLLTDRTRFEPGQFRVNDEPRGFSRPSRDEDDLKIAGGWAKLSVKLRRAPAVKKLLASKFLL